MAKRCKIIVHWLNGDVEEYHGGLHADEKLLRIYPTDSPGKAVHVPLVCIKKYLTEG